MLIKVIDGTPVTQLRPSSEKRVLLQCNTCGRRTETTFANYTNAQKKNKRNGETYCLKCATTVNNARFKGKVRPSRGVPRPQIQREKSKRWKGGRYINKQGYVMVLTGEGVLGVKNSKWERYRKEHTVVVETALGRALSKNEVVHHVDGDRQNNQLSNLVVLQTHNQHREAHHSLQKIGYALVRAGLVQFDRKKQIYVAHNKLRELLEHPDRAISSQAEVLSEGSETRGEITPPRARGTCTKVMI